MDQLDCMRRQRSPQEESNSVVQRSLDLQLHSRNVRRGIHLSALYAVVLAMLIVDIYYKCPYAESKWYYAEYVVAALLGCAICAYVVKYLLYKFVKTPLECTQRQRSLLMTRKTGTDSSFVAPPFSDENSSSSDSLLLNDSILSWHSSFNEPGVTKWGNRHSSSSSSEYAGATQTGRNVSPNTSVGNANEILPGNSLLCDTPQFVSSFERYSYNDMIMDESSLQSYIDEASKDDQIMSADEIDLAECKPVNSFWNCYNQATNLLRTSVYQLSPTTPQTPTKQPSVVESSFKFYDTNSYLLKGVSSELLSQYIANLRKWLSLTILQRLAKEISSIDETFKNRGLVDMRLGNIALERLKKTVLSEQYTAQFVPQLPLVVPFLEVSSNQEYLVQRIKDLAKGSCIAEYNWNSGSSFHGLKWDEHLPTDSAIIFHLFCVYLDSQLTPLPQGGGRPFSSRYVIMGEDKHSQKDIMDAVRNRAHCGILCTNALQPKFNFVTDKEIHSCVYDRNNLFHVIIQFLIYMRKNQHSCLEGVNLDKGGINLMCVIGDN